MDCIFCKISQKIIPANIIYANNEYVAFHDINPKADVHFLIIPTKHIVSMLELQETDIPLIGRMMFQANVLAVQLGLTGYKMKVHTGIKGGQEVFHLHIHVLGNK